MRHNQNPRRMRGGGGGGRNGGGNHSGGGHHHHHNNSQNSGRRVNPRVQSFDSNGPDVRIRGTAYQINEKYLTLARDAMSAGDRVLAESYLQHAEHYQRFINEMTEEFNLYNQQNPQQQQMQPGAPQPVVQATVDGNGAAVVMTTQPVVQQNAAGMNDLDQGFLVGPRHGNGADGAAQPQEQPQQGGQQQQRHRGHYNPRRGEPEAV